MNMQILLFNAYHLTSHTKTDERRKASHSKTDERRKTSHIYAELKGNPFFTITEKGNSFFRITAD